MTDGLYRSFLLYLSFLFFLFQFSVQINAHGFAASTLVKNSNQGWWAIEQVTRLSKKKKQYVVSYNTSLYSWVNKPVIYGALSQTNCYIIIGFNQVRKDIICTPTQEFYLAKEKKWTPAYELKQGHFLLAEKNKQVQIHHIKFVKKSLNVYSIQVQDTHTFLVSPYSILTHNMAIPVVAVGLSISFSAGCSGGMAGAAFGPIGFIGGLAIGGIIGCAIKFGMRNKVAEYKLSYNVNKIGSYLEARNKQEINKIKNSKKQKNTGGFNKNDDNDDENQLSNKVEISKDDIPHMFENRNGHLPDTPTNRNLLIDLASDMKNFLGFDKHGTEWYGKTTIEGKQLWATVRKGVIRNGGLNDIPKSFNFETGLSRFFK